MSKYSVGDKVLVEATMTGIPNCINPDKVDVLLEGLSCGISIFKESIHSLAPELKFGDHVEVSVYGKEWRDNYFFVACANDGFLVTVSQPYKIGDNVYHWKFCRKPQQPKDEMIWKDGKRYKLVPVEGDK